VNQALDTLLQLHEGAVVGQADHTPRHLGADRELLHRHAPRIRGKLLHPQRDPLFLEVQVEDLHVDLVAHAEHVGGVLDTPPGDVRDVQQAIDPAQVHEDAVLGDVLDRADQYLALVDGGQGRGALGLALFFQQHPPGQHDVAAFAVVFENFEIEGLADHFIQVADGPQVRLGAGQKRQDPDVDGEAALDAAGDGAGDRAVVVVALLDAFPHLDVGGLVLGQDDALVLVVPPFHHDLDGVADLGGDAAVFPPELIDADLALGLVADVDQHQVLVDRCDHPGDDFAFLELAEAVLVHHHGGFTGVLARILPDRGCFRRFAHHFLFRVGCDVDHKYYLPPWPAN